MEGKGDPGRFSDIGGSGRGCNADAGSGSPCGLPTAWPSPRVQLREMLEKAARVQTLGSCAAAVCPDAMAWKPLKNHG